MESKFNDNIENFKVTAELNAKTFSVLHLSRLRADMNPKKIVVCMSLYIKLKTKENRFFLIFSHFYRKMHYFVKITD